MASTKTFGDALTLVFAASKREYENSFATEACNLATSFIWNRGDWRNSIVEFTPFWLIPNEQDHGAPTFIVPSDFLGLREVFVTNLQGSTPIKNPVKVQQNVDRTAIMGIPTQIMYVPSAVAFRVFPRVPSGICAPYWLIEGNYKKVAPRTTASTLNDDTLPWDDQYFINYLDVLTWATMKLNGDPRAGGVQTGKGGTYTYTGQYALAVRAIDEMMQQEQFNIGDPQISPVEPMVGGRSSPYFW